MSSLLEPFSYGYMVNAMWVSALTGAICAFLSCYLMLKGWSLIGDALSHSIVPGVAGAYMLGLPFAAGAFLAGGLAAAAMLAIRSRTRLREDAIIGMIFTSFFALGLFMVSISPTPINVQTIVLGNVLAITPSDSLQLIIIGAVTLTVLTLIWKDLMLVFFDESHARTIGIRADLLKVCSSRCWRPPPWRRCRPSVRFLVIALVVTPGATAYLLTDRFPRLIVIAVAIGSITSFVGVYLSYFLDGATGGVMIMLQTGLFLLAFVFAPRHGILAQRAKARGAAPETGAA
jgi:manganese/iron transport system permease protein